MIVRMSAPPSAPNPSVCSVPCSSSLNLLAHAQLAELEIGSRCGGFGECGGDRVRVLSGADLLSAITEAEREHLSRAEIEQGYRLACQSFPDCGHEPGPGVGSAEEGVIELEIPAWGPST